MAKIEKVTAVAEVFPSGQKTVSAIVSYDCPISNDFIQNSFEVKDRTIVSVHADEANKNIVVIELAATDENAATVNSGPPKREMDKRGGPPKDGPKKGEGGPGPKPGPGMDTPHMKHRTPKVEVRQTQEIKTATNEVIAASDFIESTDSIQKVVDDFKQFDYKGIPYNLYIPENVESGKSYPLVMFLHDAEPCGTDPLLTLVQGIGAIRFAEKESQRKQPCFVLAPEIPLDLRPLEEECDGDIATRIKPILDEVIAKYPIDKNKIYTTGQSGGCMTSCELNHRYPDLFAASLLVAGQWNADRMRNAAQNKYWICVSEHDVQAFPGMTAIVKAFEEEGASVYRYTCDAKSDKETLNRLARDAASHGTNVIFTVFEGDSVVPEGFPLNPITNHISTWSVAYDIEAIRDWMLDQERN